MNILFIIGNGFDLNLGMKTRYKDFYDYYQLKESQSSNLHKLKNQIKGDIENWSDLEFSLGEYTERMNSLEEFDEVFEDVGANLAEYLQEEEKCFDFSDVLRKNFFDYLAFPERSLLPADKDEIVSFKEKWNNITWNVNVVTFNYTKSFEQLLGEKLNNLEIAAHHNSTIQFRGLEHIHGYVDNRMILGVNDKSQISNASFRENLDIVEAIVKNDCNIAQKHNVDIRCKDQISKSNLICIFGSSIGETDNMWWNLIGNQLKRDCKLIIFDRCEKINPRAGYLKKRKEREIKQRFLSKIKLTEEEKRKVDNAIFVGLNTDLFENILTSVTEEKVLM